MADAIMRKAAAITSNGLRRYPKEILDSLREARAARRGEPGLRPRACPIAGNKLLASFEQADLAALWIGHATVLLRMPGPNGRPITLLTDPVFSDRIGLQLGLHPLRMTVGISRFQAPPVQPEQLPSIDVVLLSHAHFDHLDKPSLERLARGPARNATVVAARRTRSLIPDGFARVVELGWNDTLHTGGLQISALRPQHWGARVAVDRRRGFNSYVLETESHAGVSPRRVLFAGDTADTDAFDPLADRGGVDLAIFGIGAYSPWEEDHATPEQVWRMYQRIARPATSAEFLRRAATRWGDDGVAETKLLPMHHSTFPLGQEPVDEPLARLLAVAASDAHRIVAHAPGDLWTCSPNPSTIDPVMDGWSSPREHPGNWSNEVASDILSLVGAPK